MTAEKVDFTGVEWRSVEWTMLVTLYLRAYDSRCAHPILHDHAAAEAVDRIDYDFDRLKKATWPSGNRFLVTLRARQFDEWAADFLDRNPDAVVLHLGCGLDSRAYRLDVPAGVHWFDLDVPEVIELRQRIYPERDGYQMIGSSVTDPGWLEKIPTDRPALVIAEGLLGYLGEDGVRQLLGRLTDRFGGGELHFDAQPSWIVRVIKIIRWGTRDARELERWNPRLRRTARTYVLSHGAEIPVRGYRIVYRVMNAIPATRNFSQLYRFEF